MSTTTSVSKNIFNSKFILNFVGVYDTGEPGNSYHWITDDIAVGDYSASYLPFRIIVNANMPHNHTTFRCVYERYIDFENKWYMILSMGMYDHESEPVVDYVTRMMPKLIQARTSDPQGKILFHCYAGRSRSVALCIGYMVETTGCTVDEALEKIRTARPFISPKEQYLTALRTHYENSKSDVPSLHLVGN